MPAVKSIRDFDVVVYKCGTGACADTAWGETHQGSDTTVLNWAVSRGKTIYIRKGVYTINYTKNIQWYDSYGNLHSADPFRVGVEVNGNFGDVTIVGEFPHTLLRQGNNQNIVVLYIHDYNTLHLEGIVFDGNRANNRLLQISSTGISPFDGYAPLLTGGCRSTGNPCFRRSMIRNIIIRDSPGWSIYLGNHSVRADQKGVASERESVVENVWIINGYYGAVFDNMMFSVIRNININTTDYYGIQIMGQNDWFNYSRIIGGVIFNAGATADVQGIEVNMPVWTIEGLIIRAKRPIINYKGGVQLKNMEIFNIDDANVGGSISGTGPLVELRGPTYVSGLNIESGGTKRVGIYCASDCYIVGSKLMLDQNNVFATEGNAKLVVENSMLDGVEITSKWQTGTLVFKNIIVARGIIYLNTQKAFIDGLTFFNLYDRYQLARIDITAGTHKITNVHGEVNYTEFGGDISVVGIADPDGVVNVEVDGFDVTITPPSNTQHRGIGFAIGLSNANSRVVLRNIKVRATASNWYGIRDNSTNGSIVLFGKDTLGNDVLSNRATQIATIS